MKRYLITGASRGIGRAIALRLAAPDVMLLLHGRDTVALAETCRVADKSGAKTAKLIHDLATFRGINDLIAEVGHKPIDLLVNNAGIAVVKPFAEITREEWEQTIGVNVTALFSDPTFRSANAAGSSIVNILSVAVKTAFPNWSIYCGSKFALEGLSTAIREGLRSRKVRMLNIYPAATDTDIWNAVSGEWPREQMMSAADVANAVAFAINQPPAVIIENITLSNTAGSL
jgi:3-oxoacyl-[acyl-carrier protein] reductase